MFNPIRHGTADNSGYAVRFAHQNPYWLRIPAKRCAQLGKVIDKNDYMKNTSL